LVEQHEVTPPGAPFGLTLKFGTDGSSALLSLSGELDLAVTDRVHKALDEVERRATEKLELDLTELSFIDVVGARAILSANDRAKERGRPQLSIRPGPRAVQRVFSLLGQTNDLPFVSP
jgi:anti-anti-sigma factor